PFIETGLEKNDLCVYIAGESGKQAVCEALEAGGLAVRKEVEAGRLRLPSREEVFLRDGKPDPQALIEWIETNLRAALDTGFDGMRITGEMCWQHEHSSCELLIEHESRLNRFFADRPVLALCQYARAHFPAAVLRDVLRTHPIAVLGSQVCTNLYHEPPELILGERGDDFRVDWMIAQLKRSRASEQALQEVNSLLETANARKDEFLAMLGHELRNPLAAINNGISLLGLGTLDRATQAHVQETIEHQMKNITRLVDDLLDVARVTRGKITL